MHLDLCSVLVILYKRRTLKCAYLRFAEQMLDFGLQTVNKRGSFKVIEFRDVTKVYGSNGTKALNNVNIKIEDGEFVFVVGASGAGKSNI